MWCKVLVFQPIDHVSVSPTDGIAGPTQGQRKTLTRVGIEPTTFGFDHRCSIDWATRSDGSRSWEMKMLMTRQWICRYKEGLHCINPHKYNAFDYSFNYNTFDYSFKCANENRVIKVVTTKHWWFLDWEKWCSLLIGNNVTYFCLSFLKVNQIPDVTVSRFRGKSEEQLP